MSFSDFQIYGATLFRQQADKVTQRAMEVHGVVQRWQAPSRNQFQVGAAPDGWPNMRIVGVDPLEEIENTAYDIRLDCEGIVDNRLFIETDHEESTPEEGWDEIHRGVFTRFPAHAWFAKGAQIVSELTGLVLPGYENMWIMDRAQKKHRAKDYFDISMVLKGLRGDKPYKRRYTGSPQTTTNANVGAYAAAFDTWVGYPPVAGSGASISGSDMTIEWDIPQTSITDVFITSTPPPTDIYPGFWTPNDPPPVFIFPTYSISYTYHVPWGWRIMNMQAEQLAGQALWLLSLTFGYQKSVTPKS